ncbi:MAG: glycosyltransferase [Vicinamibacterales bacterium]
MTPLVSVLLPVYNRPQWIGRAIESVFAQSYPRVELIVVDDGSTDKTPDVIERFGPRVTSLRQPNRGAYAARNLGLARARGELIAFIDSDDSWYPDRLSSQVPLFDKSEVGLVFGDAAIVDHDGPVPSRRRVTSFETTPPRRGLVSHHFVWGNFVPMSSVVVRRRCLDEVGGFPDSARLSADYLTWFRISLRHELDYVPSPVFEYARHQGSISRNLVSSLRARIELFEGLLATTTDPATLASLRQLLHNLHLSMLLARVRRNRGTGLAVPRGGVPALGNASLLERLHWASGFALNQLRVRLSRRMTPTARRG